MEKLIELLNERDIKDGSKRKRYFVPNRICWEGCDNSECSELLIISKKFGFIKWLVDNDKIDNSKLDNNSDFSQIYSCFEPGRGKKGYEVLLMILSISDTPIEDLISYLK